MDFHIDDSTRELAALVKDMGQQLVTDDSLRELDARFGPGNETGGTDRSTARFHARYWDELVRAGVPAALAPESLGGAGLGVVGEALVLRELGRVLAPVPLSPAIRSASLLEAAGLTERATAVAEGREIAAVADGNLRPAAEVDWAPIADVVVVPTENGLQVAERASMTVERTVPVDFSCAGLVSGELGDARPVPAQTLELDALRRRVHLSAYQWGVIEAALERTAAYASTRHQFGRPIGSFQAVAARLADASIDVDAVRLSTLRAAYELDACSGEPGPTAHAAVASAHFWACDAGHRLAHTAVHVHGGVGLDRSEPAHRYFLAAKAGEFRLGGATRQLLDLGEVLAEHGDPWEYSA
ncbi:acyl-CoA dehydrogenase family protein [Rhodococcus sp. IEGM 1408]|uniref:acyl-CoA dehydrogenase family protein n=1 Tax=Rhodococcus sp. IEGM 1408 TaxID=3082220 RepID=UPI002952CDAF|nr:acyl-CoA dehydrogenase family protein [Rhodococcus sp. IEGM 1408]MDV8002461.1 acyl-CoA dehydrogenase family protein [Rhodococcus sp. IEGM 1408]